MDGNYFPCMMLMKVDTKLCLFILVNNVAKSDHDNMGDLLNASNLEAELCLYLVLSVLHRVIKLEIGH